MVLCLHYDSRVGLGFEQRLSLHVPQVQVAAGPSRLALEGQPQLAAAAAPLTHEDEQDCL